MDYTIEDFEEIYKIILPYIRHGINHTRLENFSILPLTHEVLSASFDDVPLFIHSPSIHIREIAKWRLEHHK